LYQYHASNHHHLMLSCLTQHQYLTPSHLITFIYIVLLKHSFSYYLLLQCTHTQHTHLLSLSLSLSLSLCLFVS
jgi:hypothetical protein